MASLVPSSSPSPTMVTVYSTARGGMLGGSRRFEGEKVSVNLLSPAPRGEVGLAARGGESQRVECS